MVTVDNENKKTVFFAFKMAYKCSELPLCVLAINIIASFGFGNDRCGSADFLARIHIRTKPINYLWHRVSRLLLHIGGN